MGVSVRQQVINFMKPVLCLSVGLLSQNIANGYAFIHATYLTVLWIAFCLTGPISVCLDSFLCMYVFCVSLYIACCSIVT